MEYKSINISNVSITSQYILKCTLFQKIISNNFPKAPLSIIHSFSKKYSILITFTKIIMNIMYKSIKTKARRQAYFIRFAKVMLNGFLTTCIKSQHIIMLIELVNISHIAIVIILVIITSPLYRFPLTSIERIKLKVEASKNLVIQSLLFHGILPGAS